MALQVNPFAELYVGETVPPADFVRLFSPFLIEHALLLFQRGNVVLTGVQGSGKTMLLSLLRPSIRLAFSKANAPFPVPARHARFISAGISLRHSGVMSFGQRAFARDPEEAGAVTPLFFADYLNHALVLDLIQSLERLVQVDAPEVARSIGLATTPEAHDRFAREVAIDPCWHESHSKATTLAELKQSLTARIDAYLAFLQFNLPVLPPEVTATKTTAGVPVSRAAKALWATGVAEKDVNVFIRIDQYEELDSIRRLPTPLGSAFREVINKVVGMRDPHVFYRVGARKHAWRANLRMYGSEGGLEHQREYEEIDLEEILRRKENRRTYVFMRFAADVTRRRLLHAGYQCEEEGEKLLHTLFARVKPEDKAKRYLRSTEGPLQRRAIDIRPEWPSSWQQLVEGIARGNPLEARLAAAWVAQQVSRNTLPLEQPQSKAAMGWTREYWRKERVPQALMQLAAAAAQRMVWAGYSDIEALSGGNILVYASMAKHVWAAWLRTAEEASPGGDGLDVPTFGEEAQTAGIEEASADWFRKIAEQPRGATRKKFIAIVARIILRTLLDDRAMSYPGHNGFSIADDEVQQEPKLERWLEEASDVGDLVEVVHTTKEKDRRFRRKYYVHPILSPYLRIPAVHVKEPMYVSAKDVTEWLEEAEGDARTAGRRSELARVDAAQLPLI